MDACERKAIPERNHSPETNLVAKSSGDALGIVIPCLLKWVAAGITTRALSSALMEFRTDDGRLFALNVERYEFPDEELGPTEDNPVEDFETGRFLVVAHRFRSAGEEWAASGPTMTTDDLQRFVAWVISLRDETRSIDGIYFAERDLEFTFDEKTRAISVHIAYDSLPAWSDAAECITIDFPIQGIDLDAAIDSLRRQLAAFPGRPPIDRS